MSGRPEPLWPLFADLKGLDGIGPKTAQTLAGAGIEAPRDLLYTLPYSVTDRRVRDTVQGADLPATLTVEVLIGRHWPPRTRGGAYRIEVDDAKVRFQLVFFRGNSEYQQKLFPTGQRRLVSGRVELFDGVPQMVHPDHVLPVDEAESLPAFEPVYHLTGNVTQKLMVRAIADGLTRVPDLEEWIDAAQLAKEGWPGWAEALARVHAPEGPEDLSPTAPARARLAYDELMAHQLTLALARAARRKRRGIETKGDGRLQARVLAALPYEPTGAQRRSGSSAKAAIHWFGEMSKNWKVGWGTWIRTRTNGVRVWKIGAESCHFWPSCCVYVASAASRACSAAASASVSSVAGNRCP